MVIEDPALHDGRLRGIELTDDSGLLIKCSTEDGIAVRIVGDGLVALMATDFKEGNIIFEVRFSAADSDSEVALARLFGGHAGGIQKGNRVLSANGRLLEVASSYGCELVALFSGSIVVEPDV